MPEQHRHGVPVQRGDAADRRLRRRPDDDVRLRHGRHRVERRGTRLIAGARVERFDQTVTTQDPFGLFAREVQATNKNTDFFPAVNFVQSASARTRTSA